MSDVPSSGEAPTRVARVLVVEDEESMGRALVRFLRGYEVVYCSNITDALSKVRAGEVFDVIVSDMMMPGGTGSDFHKALAAEAPALTARMLFMTGGATTPDTLAFVGEHGARVVTKPLDLANLRRRVDGVIAELGLVGR